MKRKCCFIISLFISICIEAQQSSINLRTEKDGFQWYISNGEEHAIKNKNGSDIFVFTNEEDYEYSINYTNFHGNDNRAYFNIGRKNRRKTPKTKKERKRYEYVEDRREAIVSLDGKIVIPFDRKYEFITYKQNYFLVRKDYFTEIGVCDIHGNEIVEPIFSDILYWAGSFIGKKKNEANYTNLNVKLDEKDEIGYKIAHSVSETGYHWYEICDNKKFGATNASGKEIIPLSRGYTHIRFNTLNNKNGFFTVRHNGKEGACDILGNEIVKPIYRYVSYGERGFNVLGEDNIYRDLGIFLSNHDEIYPKPKIVLSENVKQGNSKQKDQATSNSRIVPNSFFKSNSEISSNTSKQDDYGTNSKHGKIINQTSEKQGTVVVRQEWYEDGYYSIFLMDKCKACGGTGRVGYNFCTAGCAGGFLTLLTYYDKNGNEVEKSGNMRASNSSYYGGSGGSYSGGSASGAGRSSGSSIYTKCTSCNGTGDCSGCNGKRGSWQNTGYYTGDGSKSWINCGSCRGSGKCPICYGRGKL